MQIVEVLERAHSWPFKTKSDFARQFANLVAMAASDGLITTKVATGLYGKHWMITPKGLLHMSHLKGINYHEQED